MVIFSVCLYPSTEVHSERANYFFSARLVRLYHWRRMGRGRRLPPPPHFFADGTFFLHANAWHSKPKVATRCRHAANIAFDLFNIFLYVIARKVRKCPLSPFVTSNVVLSCLVRMADILARLAQRQTACLLYN